MSKIITVSGTEISYTAKEVGKRITSEVEFKALGFEDTIVVTHLEWELEQAITLKLEGMSKKFRDAQIQARQAEENKTL